MQNRIVRVICQQDKFARTTPLFKQLRFLNLSELYVYSVLLFVYKYHHLTLPNIFLDFYEYNSAYHGYGTRQINHLHVPKADSTLRSSMIRVTGVQLSNLFKNRVNYECSLLTYKRLVKAYILNNNVIPWQ